MRQVMRYQKERLVACDRRLDKLGFIHIEKTGGMSTRLLLCSIFGDPHVGPHCDERDFADVAEKYPVLVGHVGVDLTAQAAAQVGWFTVLRHPVRRIASLMNFWAQQAQDETPHWTHGTPVERNAYMSAGTDSLEDFLRSDNEKIVDQVRNLACRRISGQRQGTLSDQDYARLAFDRLANEALFFGLQEAYHLSMLQLPVMLGVQFQGADFVSTRINKTTFLRDLDIENCAASQMHLGADLTLYEMAKDLFDRRTEHLAGHICDRLAMSHSPT